MNVTLYSIRDGKNLILDAMINYDDFLLNFVHMLESIRYTDTRNSAKLSIPTGAWNTKDLLHGSDIRYSREENRNICLAVQQFILSSNRFSK